jgi:hypothetical protein
MKRPEKESRTIWSATARHLATLKKHADAVSWKDALRQGIGVAIFAVLSVIFTWESTIHNGNLELQEWSQGCLVGKHQPCLFLPSQSLGRT